MNTALKRWIQSKDLKMQLTLRCRPPRQSTAYDNRQGNPSGIQPLDLKSKMTIDQKELHRRASLVKVRLLLFIQEAANCHTITTFCSSRTARVALSESNPSVGPGQSTNVRAALFWVGYVFGQLSSAVSSTIMPLGFAHCWSTIVIGR